MTFKNKIHHYFLPKPEKCVHKLLKMAKNYQKCGILAKFR